MINVFSTILSWVGYYNCTVVSYLISERSLGRYEALNWLVTQPIRRLHKKWRGDKRVQSLIWVLMWKVDRIKAWQIRSLDVSYWLERLRVECVCLSVRLLGCSRWPRYSQCPLIQWDTAPFLLPRTVSWMSLSCSLSLSTPPCGPRARRLT